MKVQTVSVKIGNMRKAQNFVVYPGSDDATLSVQSDTCYAKIDVATGKARFANVPGGAYSHSLIFKGKDIIVPPEIVEQFKAAKPKSGDCIGGNVFIA